MPLAQDSSIIAEHVFSTGLVLDQVLVQNYPEFSWLVTAINESDPTNKYTTHITMSHNGSSTSPATDILFTHSAILKQGVKIAGIQISGALLGSGDQQYMALHVASQVMVTFIARRTIPNTTPQNYVVPVATSTTPGGVITDGTTILNDNGVISIPKATASSLGVVTVDQTTLNIVDGVLSVKPVVSSDPGNILALGSDGLLYTTNQIPDVGDLAGLYASL